MFHNHVMEARSLNSSIFSGLFRVWAFNVVKVTGFRHMLRCDSFFFFGRVKGPFIVSATVFGIVLGVTRL